MKELLYYRIVLVDRNTCELIEDYRLDKPLNKFVIKLKQGSFSNSVILFIENCIIYCIYIVFGLIYIAAYKLNV